jgi:hypothetical protein
MKRIISLAMILGIWSQTVYPAFADSTVVSKISVTKVVVGYKKITFSFHPAIFHGAFIRNYEVGFKGHYDTSDYGDPSAFCDIPISTKILSMKTVISCVVDLSGISKDVSSQSTAKGVTMDWVIRGAFEGHKGDWSEPYSIQLYNFPQFLRASNKSPTSNNSLPYGAIAKCHDGSYSFQVHRRGACSRHGGVAIWKTT